MYRLFSNPILKKSISLLALLFLLTSLAVLPEIQAKGELWQNMGLYGVVVNDAAYDSATGTIFLAIRDYPGLYRSQDNGETWTSMVYSSDVNKVDVAHDGAAFALFDGGRFSRSTDGGNTWVEITKAFAKKYHTSPMGWDVDVTDSNHIVFGTDHSPQFSQPARIFYTFDGGTTWSKAIVTPEPQAHVKSVAVDPSNPDNVYAITWKWENNQIPSYVYRSMDGGRTFVSVMELPTGLQAEKVVVSPLGVVFVDAVSTKYRSMDGGATFAPLPYAPWDSLIEFDPVDPHVVYFEGNISRDDGNTLERYTYKSSIDDGKTFQEIPISLFFLRMPHAPNTFFTSFYGTVFRSEDNGASAYPRVHGLESIIVNEAASDAHNPDVWYLASEVGAGRSTDAGKTWDFPIGLPDSFPSNAVAVDASSPGLAALDHASWRVDITTDYGETWQPHLYVPLHAEIRDIAFVPGTHGERLCTVEYESDREHNSEVGALRCSTNGGATFSTKLEGDAFRVVTGASTPSSGTVMVAGAGVCTLPATHQGGVYKSTDGGDTWDRLGLDKAVSALAIHPLNPDMIYAAVCRSQKSVYRTLDGGVTWKALPAVPYNCDMIDSLFLDPNNPERVFATGCQRLYTSGNGGASWGVYDGPQYSHYNTLTIPLLPPYAPADFSALVSGTGADLSLSFPSDARVVGVELRFSQEDPIHVPAEGELLARFGGVPGDPLAFHHDFSYEDGKTYYYAAFVYTSDGIYSPSALITYPEPEQEEDSGRLAAHMDSVPGQESVFLSTSRGLFKNSLLAAPMPLLSPAAGQNYEAYGKVVFSWTAVPSARSYAIEVSKTADFSKVFRRLITRRTSLSVAASKLGRLDGWFYWRVRPSVRTDGKQPGLASAVWRFSLPGRPVALLAPKNRAARQPLQPLFSWKPAAGLTVDHYQVQMSSTSKFTTLDLDENTSGAVTFFTPSAPLPPGKAYYWRVRAVSPSGQFSLWSAPWRFSTAP